MDYFSQLSFPALGEVADSHRRRQTPRYYGIQFQEFGRLTLRIDNGKLWELEGAWVFLTHPGAEFEYILNPEDRHFYHYICFCGPRVRQYLDGGLLDLSPRPIFIHHREQFSAAVNRLLRYDEDHNLPRAIWQLEDLLLRLREEKSTSPETEKNASQFAELIRQIDSHPEKDWNFTELAEQKRQTIQHFRRRFRELAGTSPRQFVIQRRLERAAALLRENRLPLKEIAALCGIDDSYYFSTLFKKKYHLPPGLYRREFAKNG